MNTFVVCSENCRGTVIDCSLAEDSGGSGLQKTLRRRHDDMDTLQTVFEGNANGN